MQLSGDGFDPYHKWLGISPKDQPPNLYRLLGIELFEPDPDVIDTAASQRMAYLQQCAHGDEAELASRLLNQIAAARLCLLDKAKKSQYDQKLRGGLSGQRWSDPVSRATPAAPAPVAPATLPAAIPMDVFSSPQRTPAGIHNSLAAIAADDEPLARQTQRAARKAQKLAGINIIGHIVAPIAGLSVGAIILMFVRPEFLGLGTPQPQQQAAAPKAKELPLDPSPKIPFTPPQRVPRKQEPKIETPAPAPAPPVAEIQPPSEAPAKKVSLELLLSAVDLPTLVDGAAATPLSIGKIELAGDQKPVLELHSGFQEPSVTLEPSELDGWIISEPSRDDSKVGNITLENGDLIFRWTPQAAESSEEALRNSVLCVTADDQRAFIRLRKPVVEDPISFDAGKPKSSWKIAGESLDGIRDRLSLGSVRLEGFPGSAEIKPASNESGGPVNNITIEVSQGFPRMEVHLALDKGKFVTGSLLWIESKDDKKGAGVTTIHKAIKEIEIPLNKIRKKVEAFEADVDARINKIRANKDLAEIAKQKLIDEINAAKNKDSVYQTAKKEILAKEILLTPLTKLAKIADEMREAKIHLAVVYKCDDTVVDVCYFGQEVKGAPEPTTITKPEADDSGFAPGLRPKRDDAPPPAAKFIPDAKQPSGSDPSMETVRKTLSEAKKSLERRKMAAAQQQVTAARSLAVSDEAKAAVNAVDQLRLHVVDFWSAVSQEVESFKGGEEIAIGTERALVVEGSKEKLSILLKGNSRSYPMQSLPIPIAVSIAERRLKPDDLHSRLVFGAALAITAQADHNRGHQILKEAADAGSSVAASLLETVDAK